MTQLIKKSCFVLKQTTLLYHVCWWNLRCLTRNFFSKQIVKVILMLSQQFISNKNCLVMYMSLPIMQKIQAVFRSINFRITEYLHLNNLLFPSAFDNIKHRLKIYIYNTNIHYIIISFGIYWLFFNIKICVSALHFINA